MHYIAIKNTEYFNHTSYLLFILYHFGVVVNGAHEVGINCRNKMIQIEQKRNIKKRNQQELNEKTSNKTN